MSDRPATDAPGPATSTRAGMVTLVGWTNVGKSTLLNRLVGHKLAAVADVAQTTRSRILGVRQVPGRGQIVFVDTPGLHRPRYRMNRAMVELTRRSLDGVDLALLVVDAARGLGPGDGEAADLLRRARTAALLVLNKIDMVQPKTRLLPAMARAAEWDLGEVVPVSARTGENCQRLEQLVLERLPEGPPLFPDDYLTDQSQRTLAAEWIREQLLARVRQELPHVTAVQIDRWHERADGLLELYATILVERESQKQIVIGRGGGLLKQVGTEARRELEAMLERRVFLELWVKVRPHWRDDERSLRELGLG